MYGALMVTFGIMMTSLCTSLWQFILAQGVVVGLGSGALFLTAVAMIPTWFSTRKSLAMGIAASGSSVGGVIYPVIFRYLEPQVGFAWSVRVIGFVTLATNLFACLFVKIRHKPEERRSIFDARLFKDLTFDLWSLAWFFGNMGLYIPFFFIQDYAHVVLREPVTLAFWTLTTINAASVFGRIIPGLVADQVNDPLLIITVCTAATTILSFTWVAIRSSVAGLFVFCALYGFFSGAFVSLSTPATVHLAPSMKGIGTRLGIFNGIGSLGLLIGNPVAGAIVEKSYVGMQVFCGGACTCSLVLLGCVLVYGRGRKVLRK